MPTYFFLWSFNLGTIEKYIWVGCTLKCSRIEIKSENLSSRLNVYLRVEEIVDLLTLSVSDLSKVRSDSNIALDGAEGGEAPRPKEFHKNYILDEK